MSPAALIKISKHPAVVWFDRIAPLLALTVAIYYGWQGQWPQAALWGGTVVLAIVLSVYNITRLMEKLLLKLITRR